MRNRFLLQATIVVAASVVALGTGRAQTIQQGVSTLGTAPRLNSFTPIDSLFVNSSASSFNITLVHSATGSPTEYRVSRFADFRDASWLPYTSRPSLVVPHSWFVNVGSATSGQQETTLHFQLRTRNPLAGRPASLQPGGGVTTQPDFFFSDVRVGHIRLVFVG